MNFYQKRDYFSVAIFVLTTLAFVYSAKEVFNSAVIEALAGGFGAVAGFFLANYTSTKSLLLKSVFLGGVILFSLAGISFINSTHYGSNVPEGIYNTDATDGSIVRLRVEDDSTFLSMSPDYEEVGYKLMLKKKNLYLYKQGELVFEWKVLSLDNKRFVVTDASGEELEFTKQQH